mgnify:CR=1 FL=1
MNTVTLPNGNTLPVDQTLIEGTHRTQDLLPVFLSVLRIVDPDEYAAMVVSPFWHPPAYAMEDDSSEWWDSEDAKRMLAELFTSLEVGSPEGYCFGTHPGDGADFGFWAIEDEEE